MKEEKLKEEIEMQDNYKRFSEFWEKVRNIQDEDGDNILEWDKTNIANFCFTEGYQQGRTEATQDFLKMIDDKELLEKLAELEHNQWAVWTLYFLNHLTCKDLIEKWKFQMVTKYSDLSEKDKEKDRVWARKIIEELKQKIKEKEK